MREAVILWYGGRPESLLVSEIGDGQRTHGSGTGRHAGEADPERAVPRQYGALNAHAQFLPDSHRPAAENHTVMERQRISDGAPVACTQIHVLSFDLGVKGQWTQTAVSACARLSDWKEYRDHPYYAI